MSYAGRYSTQANSVSGINDSNDSDLPESCRIPDYELPPAAIRRCPCGTRLSRYNLSNVCNACQVVESKPVEYPRINNSIGLKGVMRCGDKYKAQRQINGHKRHLGVFDTAQEAHEAWKRAKLLPEPSVHSPRIAPD